MPALLKAVDCAPAALLDLLAQVPLTSVHPRCWVEGVDGWCFAFWPGLDGKVPWCAAGRGPKERVARDALAPAQSGRVFAPTGEVRWRMLPLPQGPTCRVVFIGNEDWFPGNSLIDHSAELVPLSCRKESYFLWGQRTEISAPDWIELRIPHRFRYPLPAPSKAESQRVQLEVEIWAESPNAWGTPHFVRWVDLHLISRE